MRRHAMDEWIDTGDEEGAAKAFDAMDERIRPPIGASPRRIIPSRTTLDACQRAGLPHRGRRHPRLAVHMERPQHRRHRDPTGHASDRCETRKRDMEGDKPIPARRHPHGTAGAGRAPARRHRGAAAHPGTIQINGMGRDMDERYRYHSRINTKQIMILYGKHIMRRRLTMALIQINVPDDVKARADAAFARNGITTPAAMKMMVTQAAAREPHPVRRSLLLPGRTRTRRGRTPRHAARRGPGSTG